MDFRFKIVYLKSIIKILATPFATGTLIQDNYQYLQYVKHFLKDNKDKKQEAISNAKDNR